MHRGSSKAQPVLRHLYGRLRNVEHSYVRVAARDEIIDQGCLAATNVDDRAVAIRCGVFDEPQRSLQVGAIPAYLVNFKR